MMELVIAFSLFCASESYYKTSCNEYVNACSEKLETGEIFTHTSILVTYKTCTKQWKQEKIKKENERLKK